MEKDKGKRKSEPHPAAGEAALARLQAQLLDSVLTGQPLPGGTQAVTFPDRAFLERSPVVLLLDQNLARPAAFRVAARTVRIVSESALRAAAREHGVPAFLLFHAPEVHAGEVRLTLQARILPPEPGQGTLGLSSIRARFREVHGAWVLQGEPEFSAE